MAYSQEPIRVKNARQNNLKNIDVEVPVGYVTLVTGVAGAGKSSLVFDVLYAEGHRRYVETFSTYARQFLEQLDRPEADEIDGVLPSISIGRTAPVKTSRSTVGTITSIDDYLRPLFSRAANLYCESCDKPVQCDTPASVYHTLMREAEGQAILICFSREIGDVSAESLRDTFRQAGFSRVLQDNQAVRLEDADLEKIEDQTITIVLDRVTLRPQRKKRLMDSLETAFKYGRGHVQIYLHDNDQPMLFSSHLHCPDCDIEYADPTPALFSFNNPVGACERCNGFGRIIDIDPELVIPDPRASLAEGCVKPFQTDSFAQCQSDLLNFARDYGIPIDVPWQELEENAKQIIWNGDPRGWWYGIQAFFDWLESRRYRKHARILMSRYRRYLSCPQCRDGKLKNEALHFYLNGKTFPEVQSLSIAEALQFFQQWQPPSDDAAIDLLLSEIRERLSFLKDVGLQYLTLDRKSRTLSGGETQRVTLATALGASLTNTLYVLDEPSVGLHARDKEQLAKVLQRLSRLGNAVVVVEHDPAFIETADEIIDLGPGPGAEGGNVVFQGKLQGLLKNRKSLTGAYFSGRRLIPHTEQHRETNNTGKIHIKNASENNLCNVSLDIPLQALTCVSGVSGSGKSTLIDYVLYRNILRQQGLQAMEPGECEGIFGLDAISDVDFVDQSPLSRSSRMNAATYMKVLDPLRTVFANSQDARILGFTKSEFTFNTTAGACPHCEGSGFERVELQFLPDAFVRCPACDGKRFRSEVLEVQVRDHNIAEVLELSAAEVAELFKDKQKIVDTVQPLIDIGLGYLSLNQSAPTLSGGEAQRLKIARQLAQARHSDNALFLLDEPTTGLHPANVKDLVKALHKLVEEGHTVVVIEHDLNMIRAADHVIELGPEGGNEGGRIVAEGTVEKIEDSDTPTGRALQKANKKTPRSTPASVTPLSFDHLPQVAENSDNSIKVIGAREHNLANINIDFPRNLFTAVTGVSGSGKSTLAFDVLYSEGRQRFLDCLPAYARQYTTPLSRADVDKVEAIPPTVALQQKVSPAAAMSTTGTVSEIYHYLRLLYASLGVPHCPNCDIPGEKADPPAIAQRIIEQFSGRRIQILAPLIKKRKGYHKDIIERTRKRGFEEVRVDGEIYNSSKPPSLDRYKIHDVEAVISQPAVDNKNRKQLTADLESALKAGSGTLKINVADENSDRLFSTHRSCPECGAGLPTADPRLFIWSQKFGACPECNGRGVITLDDIDNEEDQEHSLETPCSACSGMRLRPEALAVYIGGKNIGELAALPFSEVKKWLQNLSFSENAVTERVLPELKTRLELLEKLGVGYLTVDRTTNTLATGEAQRVRIAAELSSNLRGVCYVLDEPTVGLHQRDIQALLDALKNLRDHGNTVVVVEHEESLIQEADNVIDMGPGAGTHGGKLVADGSPEEIRNNENSTTARWLQKNSKHTKWPRRQTKNAKKLRIKNAKLHNLKNINASIPLQRLICVTGVSGSGKSTLVRDVTYNALKDRLRGHKHSAQLAREIQGFEKIRTVKEVDESPIGRTPRSVPATYIGVMDNIREIFATTADARTQGYKPGRFSFNVKGGRCETCGGQGQHKVEMPLLPIVYVPCDECNGQRYNEETLNVKYNDHTISDVLNMTVDEARDFFQYFPQTVRPLQFLSDIGLGYIRLGQPSPTLSGGEAQRLKLAAEMAGRSTGDGFYVLDEPTTGLHMADVAKLINTLQDLVDKGNTVVVIEHDLDMIAAADHVIDLGPEGGDEGGRIVTSGTPEKIAECEESRTGFYLNRYFNRSP